MSEKRLPAYVMPLHPTTTDHIIGRQFDQFNYLLPIERREGRA